MCVCVCVPSKQSEAGDALRRELDPSDWLISRCSPDKVVVAIFVFKNARRRNERVTDLCVCVCVCVWCVCVVCVCVCVCVCGVCVCVCGDPAVVSCVGAVCGVSY